MYICRNCHKEVEDISEGITCPYCGEKILIKKRPEVVKKVKAE